MDAEEVMRAKGIFDDNAGWEVAVEYGAMFRPAAVKHHKSVVSAAGGERDVRAVESILFGIVCHDERKRNGLITVEEWED